MMWWIVIYLLVSLVVSEGFVYNQRRTGARVRLFDYIVAIALGPILLIVFIGVALVKGRYK